METAGRTGRIVGILILVHMLGSGIVNFFLERPLSAAPGFLVNAAPISQQIGAAVILGLLTEVLWLGVAITVFPIFFSRAQRMAVWLVALAVVSFTVAVVENIGVMSMVSLSEAYTNASATEREQIQPLGIVVSSARNWPHFISRIFVGCTTLVFFSWLYRFAAVPRAIAAFGVIAAVLMVTAVAMPLFGYKVIFPMLAPMGISQLILVVWLITKGLQPMQPKGGV